MQKHIFLIFVMVLGWSALVFAQEGNKPASGGSMIAPFGLYKPLYFLIGSPDDLAIEQSKVYSHYTKFQISFYFRVLYWEKDQNETGLYFAYTQKSLWHLFNNYGYPYFVETNYSPEFFYRIDLGSQKPANRLKYVQLGIWQHESNGHMDHNARNWDRVYAEVKYEALGQYLTVVPKIWYTFNKIPANDDIHDYLGIGELQLVSQVLKNSSLFDLTLMLTLKKGLAGGFDKGSLELNVIVDPFNFQGQDSAKLPLGFFFQYFTGYGETLLLYNKKETSFRAGFTLQLR